LRRWTPVLEENGFLKEQSDKKPFFLKCCFQIFGQPFDITNENSQNLVLELTQFVSS